MGRHKRPFHNGSLRESSVERDRGTHYSEFHPQLAGAGKPGRLPVPFARFDMLTVAAGAVALVLSTFWPAGTGTGDALAVAGIMHLARLGRWAGDRTMRERLLLILHIGYAFVPLGFLLSAGGVFFRRHSCLDGRGRGRDDPGGDEFAQRWGIPGNHWLPPSRRRQSMRPSSSLRCRGFARSSSRRIQSHSCRLPPSHGPQHFWGLLSAMGRR